jgi:stress response protein YsnF
MTHTVIGLFESKTEAQAAMQELKTAGFAQEHIDLSNRRFDETTGSATGGATSGNTDGISGFFNSLFGDDATTAQNYTNVASDAEAILTVQTDSEERARQISDIFDRNGALDVNERANQHQASYAQSGGTTQNATQQRATTDTNATTGDMTIPVIEEDLQVGKRTVEQGGVRVRSRIIERPVEERLRLREEHVVVNRHAVNRAVTESDLSSFKEGEIELTERSEQAVVSKQARVVEEVEIGKQVSEREEVVRDTVRSTDVDVEEINTEVRQATNK